MDIPPPSGFRGAFEVSSPSGVPVCILVKLSSAIPDHVLGVPSDSTLRCIVYAPRSQRRPSVACLWALTSPPIPVSQDFPHSTGYPVTAVVFEPDQSRGRPNK